MQAPCIFLFFPEENCSTGPERAWHWHQGTSTAREYSETFAAHLQDFGFTSLPCGSAQVAYSPSLFSLLSLKRYHISPLQPIPQNICEEQVFIHPVTASDPAGIAEAWHEGRLCAAQKPGPSSSKPDKECLFSSTGELGSQPVSEWSCLSHIKKLVKSHTVKKNSLGFFFFFF